MSKIISFLLLKQNEAKKIRDSFIYDQGKYRKSWKVMRKV